MYQTLGENSSYSNFNSYNQTIEQTETKPQMISTQSNSNQVPHTQHVANHPPLQDETIHIQSSQHRSNLIKNNDIVVIKYYTNWCAPCKGIIGDWQRLFYTYNSDQAKVILASEDMSKNFYGKPPVFAVPVFHFYVYGKFQEQMTISGPDIKSVETQILNLIKELDK